MARVSSFVQNQGSLPLPVANSASVPAWTIDRFVDALRTAGVHNVGVGHNAEAWYQEVLSAANAGCLTFSDYVSVRANDACAKFCHKVALVMAVANYGQ